MSRNQRDTNINIGGNVSDSTIHIGDTTTVGYTSEEVSTLLTQITSTFQPKPFDGRCPYKGLDVFEEEDAALFFGREKLVADLVGRVKDSRTLFISGPSGSGKSSLARAGLIYALKQGAIKGSERWLYATMKPGRDPIGKLGRVTASLAGTTNAEDEIREKSMKDASIFARWCEIALKEGREKRFVLFIDQFEEIFTQINREEERVTFLNLLTHAAEAEGGRVSILFAMRSDFVPNCATYPRLNALLNRQFIQIGAMQPEELVSAIAQPALRVGLRIDPDLVAQVINDMKGEPGALPLMQFALKDLFDAVQARGGMLQLTLDDYLQRGGIQKSLERHADAAFASLGTHEQELARSIFSGLIEIGRGTQDTKRTALFDELIPANAKGEEVQAIIRKLADARLITTDETAGKDTVTISHERLIDAWPWLKKLVNENRDVIALQNEIASDAKEWEEHKRDASYLYTGGRLANVHEQLAGQKLILNGLAQQFVQAGHVKQRRGQVALISGLFAVIAFLALAVIIFSNQSKTNAQMARQNAEIANIAQAASTLAFDNAATAQANANAAATAQANAEEQARFARAGELSAQSILMHDKNFQLSLLLGIEAYRNRTAATVQTRRILLENIQAHPQLRVFLTGDTNPVYSVAFSPDSKTLASGSADGSIILWDVATHQPIGQPLTGHTDWVTSVDFSPDGKILASGSGDNTIILWDVSTHQSIGQSLTGHTGWWISSVAFSPDSKTLASGSGDNTIILWDVSTHQPIGQPLTSHAGYVTSVAFSPDGKTLASSSGDNTIILWDVSTHQPIGQPLKGHTDWVTSMAFNPDGKTLVSGGCSKIDSYFCQQGEIILWNVATHQPIGQPLTGHAGDVTSVTFSPDGKTLASGSCGKIDSTYCQQGKIILWNVTTHQPIGQPLTGHADYVNTVAFSPDGKTLASGSDDNSIILWDVSTVLNAGVAMHQSIGQPLTGHTYPVTSVAFSPDGKSLASGSWDSFIILWNLATHQPIGQPLKGHTDWVTSVAFSPDGKTLASGSNDNTIILWDVATHQPIGQPLTGHTGYVTSVAFSPNGKTLASGSWGDSIIILWDVATQQPIGQPLTDTVNPSNIAFSPDGKTLASGGLDNSIILWDVTTHQIIGQPLMGHIGDVTSKAFSPDGKTLAVGSYDNSIILWDIATHQPIGQPLTGHTNPVYSVAFSPDGKTLASGSRDNSVILWDIATHQPIGQPLTGHTDCVTSVAFSPDGKTLASGSWDNSIILWDVDPQSWAERSCQRVGRNLTRAEWDQYIGDTLPYQAVCENLPIEPEPTPTATP